RELEDGVDYVPTRLGVLWGHHYTSIAGAAPIVGPAIAVIWGWLPALLWVALGTVLMGAVHDFAALVISLRHRGRSIGEIAGRVISPRVRTLFLLIISLLIWIVLAVFAFIIGTLFHDNPGAIFPINVQILVALALGWLVHRRGVGILVPSLLGYGLLLAAIFQGNAFAESFPAIADLPVATWVWILLLYSFVASVLPVWLLLQPRDYLNAHQLITGLVLLSLGLLVLHPTIQAPVVNLTPEGAPPMIPFLFITIACGAISGFHGLVSSGTTSKQVGCMTDARPIGYGGMLGEGTLGLLAVLAATAGFATTEDWSSHYASWGAASGLDRQARRLRVRRRHLRGLARHRLRDGADLHGGDGDRLRGHLPRHRRAHPAADHRRARRGLRGPAAHQPLRGGRAGHRPGAAAGPHPGGRQGRPGALAA
ncbi:MAG: hypothetical protein GWN46_07670, partial [Gammaproteobacteria bacterium]|nr:hypothetical protein [Gammaproteobacteria bacterium]